jgi:hypothetical protein
MPTAWLGLIAAVVVLLAIDLLPVRGRNGRAPSPSGDRR